MKTSWIGVTIDNGIGFATYAIVAELAKWRSEFDRQWPTKAHYVKVEARLNDGTTVWKRKTPITY